MRFSVLLHHVTVERLEAAYRAIRPGAVAGVDGVAWRDYGLISQRSFGICTPASRGARTGRSRLGGRR
jgi:hypothetical protein